MREPGLFPRQRALLREVRRLTKEQGYPPTIRELAQALGVRSPNGVRQQLLSLERKGCLRREPGKPRGIVLADSAEEESIPILGLVAAGSPIDAAEMHRGRLALGPSLGVATDRCFAVEVEGESMIGEHIVQGDFVVLDPGVEPRNGHIVGVTVDGAVTLKTYHSDYDGVELRPANPRMRAIQIRSGTVHDARVMGVAVAVVRRLG
ncbi:repressor LexA [Candidatus Fermentibacteria bacterium]|nr:repressor LexA [Candidatus Fermentibacteria bacterium]